MENSFTSRNDPFGLFADWLNEAEANEPNDYNAVSLASVDDAGMPNVRVVLLKGFDERGFVFYTNFESTKGQEVQTAMKAAMGFHWKTLRRQIRIRGAVEIVTSEEADEYFKSRHPLSRLGAWASQQSRPLDSRETLMTKVAEFRDKFGEDNIPRPPHWSGFRIKPDLIEFWQDGDHRLHDRIVFTRQSGEGADVKWGKERLNP